MYKNCTESLLYNTVLHHIPQDSTLYRCSCNNLKSSNFLMDVLCNMTHIDDMAVSSDNWPNSNKIKDLWLCLRCRELSRITASLTTTHIFQPRHIRQSLCLSASSRIKKPERCLGNTVTHTCSAFYSSCFFHHNDLQEHASLHIFM
jgi:hypothetical protein